MSGLARLLIVAGAVLVATGLLLLVLGRLLPLSHLPGDVTWRGRHATILVPLGTCLLLSLILTLVLNLLLRR